MHDWLTPGPVVPVPKTYSHDTTSNLFVFAELPGTRKRDVVLNFDKGTLTITAKREDAESQTDGKDEDAATIYMGGAASVAAKFRVTLKLPDWVDANSVAKVKTTFANGLLEVCIPKKAGEDRGEDVVESQSEIVTISAADVQRPPEKPAVRQPEYTGYRPIRDMQQQPMQYLPPILHVGDPYPLSLQRGYEHQTDTLGNQEGREYLDTLQQLRDGRFYRPGGMRNEESRTVGTVVHSDASDGKASGEVAARRDGQLERDLSRDGYIVSPTFQDK